MLDGYYFNHESNTKAIFGRKYGNKAAEAFVDI
jgi:hypothetical protein